MNILVCFTVTPDFDVFREGDWAEHSDPTQGFSHCRMVWDCFDESALEWALRLADEWRCEETEVRVTALTVSDEDHPAFLKTLAALPFDRVVRIDQDTKHQPEQAAGLIAAFIRDAGGYDLILMGQQGSMGGNALVPIFTAEAIGLPCIGQTLSMHREGPDTLQLRRNMEGGVLEEIYRLPVEAAVGNSDVNYLRVPTLKDRIKASKKEIELIPVSALSSENIALRRELVSLMREQNPRVCRIVTGDSVHEKAAVLYHDHLKELLFR